MAYEAVMIEGNERTAEYAHDRVDELLLEVRKHVVVCYSETRQQNGRLRRLESILITSAGATIVLLITLVVQ